MKKYFLQTLSLAVILPLALLSAGVARADFLNLTERSSAELDVDLSIGGFTFSEANMGPGDSWIVGGEFGPLPLFTPHTQDNQTQVYVIGWIEPGGSIDNLAADSFNILGFSPSGNHGTTNLVVLSDQTYATFLADSFQGCVSGGVFVSCPILLDGQSSDVPYELREPLTDNLFGTLTVTFSDRGDVVSGVPEPASGALMLTGFLGLGAMMLHRRRISRNDESKRGRIL